MVLHDGADAEGVAEGSVWVVGRGGREPDAAEAVDDVLVCDLDVVTAGWEVGAEEGGHVWEEAGFEGGIEWSWGEDAGEPVRCIEREALR